MVTSESDSKSESILDPIYKMKGCICFVFSLCIPGVVAWGGNEAFANLQEDILFCKYEDLMASW